MRTLFYLLCVILVLGILFGIAALVGISRGSKRSVRSFFQHPGQPTRKQKRSFEKAQEAGWNGDDLPPDLFAQYFTEKGEDHNT